MKLVAKTRTVTKALAKERFFFVAPITLAVIIIASAAFFTRNAIWMTRPYTLYGTGCGGPS